MDEQASINSGGYWDERFQKDWAEKGGGEYTRTYAELLVQNLPDWLIHAIRSEKMSMCDWGCAEGEAAAYLAQVFPGQRIHGVDIAETAVQHASEKFPDVEFAASNWLEDGFTPPVFDLVVTSHVLEHFSNPTHILREKLAPAAQKLLIMLVPFAEDPARKDKEHFFRFLHENVFVRWSDWQCVSFRIMDTRTHPGACWCGFQLLMVYARTDWLSGQNTEFTLCDFTSVDDMREEQFASLQMAMQLAKKKLELQYMHDQNLLRVNADLRQKNADLHQECDKLQAEFRQEKDTLETQLNRLEMRNEQLRADVQHHLHFIKMRNQILYSPPRIILFYMRAILRRLKRLFSAEASPSEQGNKISTPPISKPLEAKKAVSRIEVKPAARQTARKQLSRGQVRVGAILDTFSSACFAPECQLITFTPQNWQETLENAKIDFLLVESAWQGNGGAWEYRIASFNSPAGYELDEVLHWCNERNIPTVFWNKEDPPNYDRFIQTAVKFDYIFTTDAHCIESYKKRCGHDRVMPLPFAAQSAIHNPVCHEERTNKICFAGTYYADCFAERRRTMENVLRASVSWGLDIFDRMYGHTGADKERYLFPEEFHPYIQGKLDYEDMLAAYRRYRVFLNVNSVSDSPTMFARRVFELMACGTPVVSTPSVGIEQMFGDLVPCVQTVEEARAALAPLMEDPLYWQRISARGVREVMQAHTYSHRFSEICAAVGLEIPVLKSTLCYVLILPNAEPLDAVRMLKEQSQVPDRVFVLDGTAEYTTTLNEAGFDATACTAAQFTAVIKESPAETVGMLMDMRCAYGPNYILDALLSLQYTGVSITGMDEHFELDPVSNLPVLTDDGEKAGYMAQRCLRSTLSFRVHELEEEKISLLLSQEPLHCEILCWLRSPFEFILNPATKILEEHAEIAYC